MSDSAYRTWRTYSAKVGLRSYEVATKAGVFAHGRLDPAAVLLAKHAQVASSDTVVHLNCGNGLAAAVMAHPPNAIPWPSRTTSATAISRPRWRARPIAPTHW